MAMKSAIGGVDCGETGGSADFGCWRRGDEKWRDYESPSWGLDAQYNCFQLTVTVPQPAVTLSRYQLLSYTVVAMNGWQKIWNGCNR